MENVLESVVDLFNFNTNHFRWQWWVAEMEEIQYKLLFYKRLIQNQREK